MNIRDKAFDANQITDKVLEADVLIIGSGAGGGISAEMFAQAGFKVLIVEEGPLQTARDFKMRETDAYPKLYQEASARKTADKAINILQGRMVGGSTGVNWTSCFRTPEPTLEHWQSEWGLETYTPKLLEPWFAKAEQRLNIEAWSMPPNANNAALKTGAQKLGWSHQPIARNVKGCANLGYCGMGCPINAKQSMLVTTIPSALKEDASLLYQARVERLLLAGDKITGCEVVAVDINSKANPNQQIQIKAKHTIVAAGAIGSPALLLRSKLPDPNNLIGKRTFLHPVVVTSGLMKEKVHGYSGAPQTIYSDEFLWPKKDELGFKLETAPLHPLLVSTVISSFGQQHFELMKQFSNLQGTLALMRDGFSEQSIGGQVKLDEYNYPKLDYPLNDYFWQSARTALLRMTEMLFAADANKVLPMHIDASLYSNWASAKKAIQNLSMGELKTLVVSAHVMGGCSMGSDEKVSVVDAQGKFRNLQGLHIFDGSIFPTSIGANPQLSIYGMVMRLATELVEDLKNG